MATLAEKLKKARERKKFSMAQVARMAAESEAAVDDRRSVIMLATKTPRLKELLSVLES